MNEETGTASARLLALRAEFDNAFAAPHIEREAQDERILVITVGNSSVAIRLRDIREVVARRKVLRLPQAPKNLLGVVGLKGEAVPVYLLASLLQAGGDDDAWRWLLVVGKSEPLALAITGLEASVAVSESALTPLESPRPFVASLVRIADRALPVIAVQAVSDSIRLTGGAALAAGGRE